MRAKCLSTVVLALAVVVGVHASQKIVLKVNLADESLGEFLGETQVFDLDEDKYAKTVGKAPIQGTEQSRLFQKQRFSRDRDFMIRVPVPDGVYTVTLLMAETYEKACVPQARVFDIFLGTPVSGLSLAEQDFDLFSNAGCNTAYGKRFENVISKEGIIIHLAHKKQHPSLAGFIVEGFPIPKGDGSEFKALHSSPIEEDVEHGNEQAISNSVPGPSSYTDAGVGDQYRPEQGMDSAGTASLDLAPSSAGFAADRDEVAMSPAMNSDTLSSSDRSSLGLGGSNLLPTGMQGAIPGQEGGMQTQPNSMYGSRSGSSYGGAMAGAFTGDQAGYMTRRRMAGGIPVSARTLGRRDTYNRHSEQAVAGAEYRSGGDESHRRPWPLLTEGSSTEPLASRR